MGLDPALLAGGPPPAGTIPSGLPAGLTGLPPGVVPTGLPPAGLTGLPPGVSPTGLPSGTGSKAKRADLTISFPSIPGKPTYQQISQLGTLPSLFVGLGGCFTVPIAMAIGTRPTILTCAILALVCIIWGAASKGADRGLWSHLGARCVLGLSAGAIESLGPLIIQDLNFIHHRNSRFAILWSAAVSPISLWNQ
jgi:hypothetical protein